MTVRNFQDAKHISTEYGKACEFWYPGHSKEAKGKLSELTPRINASV